MVMKKTALIIFLANLFIYSHCWADEHVGTLTVGSGSVRGDFQIVRDMGDGFWKFGVSGLYAEDNDTEYKWGEVGFMVGSDLLHPGLTCEVGLKGLIGEAEDYGLSGDVGAVAFSGRASYDFAQQMTISGSFEVFIGLDYANDILSFLDTDDYFAFHTGVDIPLFEHAAVILEYSVYDMDMTSGPGRWELDDELFRIGLSVSF